MERLPTRAAETKVAPAAATPGDRGNRLRPKLGSK